MKIALIYNKESEHTTGVYLEKAIKAAGIPYEHFWTEHASSIPKEFDLYFRIDHGDYKYDIPLDLRPAVFWAIDTHLKKPYKKIRRQARHYDIVFCVHKDGAEKLKKDLRQLRLFQSPLYKQKPPSKRLLLLDIFRNIKGNVDLHMHSAILLCPRQECYLTLLVFPAEG